MTSPEHSIHEALDSRAALAEAVWVTRAVRHHSRLVARR